MADVADPPAAPDGPASPPGAGLRLAAVWHRIRSGEDPLAFGAVVVALALAAGLFWFSVGSRRAAGASSERTAGTESDRGAGKAARVPARPVEPTAAVASPGPTSGGLPAAPGASEVAVHVAGAVVRPGLYHLPGGSRVADSIAAAGGRLPRADLDRLNLAARLADGQKVVVARRGEVLPADVVGGGPADGSAGPAEPIDLNTADLAALDSLPGVGPATARAIVEERTRRGGFRSTRDLLRIPGIGESRFARLKDHVRV